MEKIFHEYHGGFSEGVYYSRNFQNYINSGVVAGYIGSGERTIARDKIIENALSNAGLGNSGITFWLTSTSARHMMDSVEEETLDREFKKIAKLYSEFSFVEVVIWSNPDYTGNLKSTNELKEKIKKAFCQTEK